MKKKAETLLKSSITAMDGINLIKLILMGMLTRTFSLYLLQKPRKLVVKKKAETLLKNSLTDVLYLIMLYNDGNVEEISALYLS